MSILIKDMEMPKSCYDCVLSHSFFRDMNCANLEGMSGFVGALPHTDDRHPDCPLVLVTQPKTGRWVLSGGYWRCSECKEKALLKLDKSNGGCNEYMPIKSNYCPNCGIEMSGRRTDIMREEKRCCGTCQYYYHENRVCVNDASEYVGDWTEYNNSCEEWTEREENT